MVVYCDALSRYGLAMRYCDALSRCGIAVLNCDALSWCLSRWVFWCIVLVTFPDALSRCIIAGRYRDAAVQCFSTMYYCGAPLWCIIVGHFTMFPDVGLWLQGFMLQYFRLLWGISRYFDKSWLVTVLFIGAPTVYLYTVQLLTCTWLAMCPC